ncbi:SAM-dependent methyltransferase [Pontibacter aydingkolensis]|uniref:Methyltransferase domain-containing protein n=1 Tax=Pontibacter aydingkolensis TaxID=1911536 RepID=A0ABS7CYY1_9BACT|nr:methyltransferase domain-containing protein [Pontibacter aydingkolensis]MBW7469059.1 methyltransferase domain-containing protein [Pontibacter aydingkolensis]
MKQDFNADYWQQRYTQHNTGWDTGSITTPLKDYFDQLENKALRILIPGCGNAYEAEYLYQNGFKNVFLVDFAPGPLQNFAQRVPDFPVEQLLHQDFFELEGEYDLIVEQTFFCALNPALRPEYARKAASLLKPGGKLAGLLFNTTFQKPGPPFGGNREEYRLYFEPYFNFLHFELAYNSIPPRQGNELFILLEVK